jgi:outer membrane lipoprotein carrier protein
MKLGLILISVLAGLYPLPEDKPPTVSTLVQRFESRYRASKTLQANFLETYFDSGKVVRTEAGTAYFGKPGKMRWEYGSPEANLYVVDGKWSWFYVPADHTVTRARAKQSSDSRTPLALLAGEMKVSRICRNVVLENSPDAVQAQGVVLRCNLRGSDDTVSATSANPAISSTAQGAYALFELNPRTGELLRILVVDSGGVQVEFRFSNWQFDPLLQASKFSFQPSKGIAIVDGEFGATPDARERKPER